MKKIHKIDKGNVNALYEPLTQFLTVDLWFLLRVRRYAKTLIRLLTPLLKTICTMGLGASIILFASTWAHINIDIAAYKEDYLYKRPKPVRNDLLGLTDLSSTDTSLLQRELLKLQNKALSLEITLRKMKYQFRNFCVRTRVRDKELADFASEAAGGSVINTPETESYYRPEHAQATIFGIPIWAPNYFTPRKVIQPWTQAGECWAFRGSRGKVEIELARTAMIDYVTLEHIPVGISLTGLIDSAPRQFNVLGNFRNKYLTIDTFIYNINGPPTQTFHIKRQDTRDLPFRKIMLEILSNWGHPEYTCIYRFKVHGRIFNILG